MSLKIEGEEINNEFDFFCAGQEIDGALRLMMKKVYRDSGNSLGVVQSALLQMGHEGMKKETNEHTWAILEEQETVALLIEKPDRKKLAERNATALKKALYLGINTKREGD